MFISLHKLLPVLIGMHSSLTRFVAVKAHSVEIRSCITPIGNLRIFVEHWHGPNGKSTNPPVDDDPNDAGTMVIRDDTDGIGSEVELFPIAVANSIENSATDLPGCVEGGTSLDSTCNEPYGDWVYYEFPTQCNKLVKYTFLSGTTVVLTDGCAGEPGLLPSTITGTFYDTTPPVLYLNGEECVDGTLIGPLVTSGPDVTTATATYATSANDDCDSSPTLTLTHESGSSFDEGDTEVTLTGTDQAGRSGSCTFIVRVERGTDKPSITPSSLPTLTPSLTPSSNPSKVPSDTPSSVPSHSPSKSPSTIPTITPSSLPTLTPSLTPSSNPTKVPSDTPSSLPSHSPSKSPSTIPTISPTLTPSQSPSILPSSNPSIVPSETPSDAPTDTASLEPSLNPSAEPSVQPSSEPSLLPSVTPSEAPSSPPSDIPTLTPSSEPSLLPSVTPSDAPTSVPSDAPSSVIPSLVPSKAPSSSPTTASPTSSPSIVPSSAPTVAASDVPSNVPTINCDDYPDDFGASGKLTCAMIRKYKTQKREKSCKKSRIYTYCPTTCGICCQDDPSFVFTYKNRERDCEWLRNENTSKKIAKICKQLGKSLQYGCIDTCDACWPYPAPTSAPA